MLEWHRDRTQHDFFRCCLCKRVLTGNDERRALGSDGSGVICSCGHAKYSITWPIGPEWLLPRVLWYSFQVIVGRHVLPWIARKTGRG